MWPCRFLYVDLYPGPTFGPKYFSVPNIHSVGLAGLLYDRGTETRISDFRDRRELIPALEHFLSLYETLGSIPSTVKKKNK
jgi:hypothetical protein